MVITVYRIDSGFGNVTDRVTLTPPPSDLINRSAKYELPDGYTVDDNNEGDQMVYDPEGNACELCLNNRSGSAVLAVSSSGSKALKRAVDADNRASLRDLRAKAQLTQQQLADAAGVNISQIQKLEAGTIKAENISLRNGLALADALGVEPEDLLNG